MTSIKTSSKNRVRHCIDHDKQISPLDEYGVSQKIGPDFIEHDVEYNPEANPPQDAKAWLNLLQEAEDVFDNWHTRCDNIDKKYANIDRLVDLARAKEFQMFWANLEVIKPAIYAKAPVPVVVPKFKDRRPVYQAASEVMERCCTVAFDLAEIDELMKLIRDDLAMTDRGVSLGEVRERWSLTTASGFASTSRTGGTSCIRSRATGARSVGWRARAT